MQHAQMLHYVHLLYVLFIYFYGKKKRLEAAFQEIDESLVAINAFDTPSCGLLFVFVVTGAGISTESGIPDYRSEGVGLYARTNHRPMKIQEFLASSTAQQRYWARNYMGWLRFYSLKPNIAHYTVKEWESNGRVTAIVTQNVDGLHEKAKSQFVIPLHGTGHVVKCLSCSFTTDRHLFQNILTDMNSNLTSTVIDSMIRPDGDIDLPQVRFLNLINANAWIQ